MLYCSECIYSFAATPNLEVGVKIAGMKSHLELEVGRITDIYITIAVNIVVFGEITMYTIHNLVKICT